jgi:aconitate decarboxylase
MSTKYCIAAQLVDRSVLPAQFTTANLNRDEIWDAIEKVECECDPTFSSEKRWATRVSVQFEDGTSLDEQSEGPRTTHDPLSNQEIVRKWRKMANSCIAPARRAHIEELVLNIEHLADVGEIARALEGTTRCSMT